MFESYKMLLGPGIGFLFTIATIVFIGMTAHRTARPGALEAFQAAARGENPEVPSPPSA